MQNDSLKDLSVRIIMMVDLLVTHFEDYHGGGFTGNTARMLLRNVHYLQFICPVHIMVYHNLNLFLLNPNHLG